MRKRLPLILLSVLLSAPAAILAQTPETVSTGLRAFAPVLQGDEQRFAFLVRYLDLSAFQAQRARHWFNAAGDRLSVLNDRLAGEQQALETAVRLGDSPSEVTRRSRTLGAIYAEIRTLEAATWRQFYLTLAPEQRDRLGRVAQIVNGSVNGRRALAVTVDGGQE